MRPFRGFLHEATPRERVTCSEDGLLYRKKLLRSRGTGIETWCIRNDDVLMEGRQIYKMVWFALTLERYRLLAT